VILVRFGDGRCIAIVTSLAGGCTGTSLARKVRTPRMLATGVHRGARNPAILRGSAGHLTVVCGWLHGADLANLRALGRHALAVGRPGNFAKGTEEHGTRRNTLFEFFED
jgi:hypothetical protein